MYLIDICRVFDLTNTCLSPKARTQVINLRAFSRSKFLDSSSKVFVHARMHSRLSHQNVRVYNFQTVQFVVWFFLCLCMLACRQHRLYMNEKLKESSFSRLIFYISICQKLKRFVCLHPSMHTSTFFGVCAC